MFFFLKLRKNQQPGEVSVQYLTSGGQHTGYDTAPVYVFLSSDIPNAVFRVRVVGSLADKPQWMPLTK